MKLVPTTLNSSNIQDAAANSLIRDALYEHFKQIISPNLYCITIDGHFPIFYGKKSGSRNMIVLYPKTCYNEVCYIENLT